MKTEQQMREMLAYYQDLAQRAHDYWAERTDDTLQSNYLRVTEYRAKADALAWALGDPQDSTGLPHTVFYPDFASNR